jgi:hypothetical protein
MIHPATRLAFIDEAIGHGVIATELIPRGTIVWVRDPLDRKLTEEEFQGLFSMYGDALGRYVYVDSAGLIVLCWDIARYINHSCEPNCMSTGLDDVEIAVRDIHPGEQLTNDYGSLNITFVFDCHCGAARCRRSIDPADVPRLAPVWEAHARQALAAIPDVPQALWPLVRENDADAIQEMLRARQPGQPPTRARSSVTGDLPAPDRLPRE